MGDDSSSLSFRDGDYSSICKEKGGPGASAVANFPPTAGLEPAQSRVGASFHNLERPESKLGVEVKF
jgi:hypothetical protein